MIASVQKGGLQGLLVITPKIFSDDRGWFFESFNEDKYHEIGIMHPFAQDNHSSSTKNTLRGLHFQSSPGQAKLVRCTQGVIWDVAVDIRPASPDFGKWFGIELSAKEHTQFYIPVGFAHGFCVLSDFAEVQYKCSTVYNPETEDGIAWDDPDIGVQWPISEPLLSSRDMSNQSFKNYCA
jgi:dTDP-4-dehydrorhamnose 3,5-epimerase